jgi:hypothetical protein
MTVHNPDPSSRASRVSTYLRQREGTVRPCVGVLYFWQPMLEEQNKEMKNDPTS